MADEASSFCGIVVPTGLVLAQIKSILVNDKDYQTDELKLGAIWSWTLNAGLTYTKHKEHIEVTHD